MNFVDASTANALSERIDLSCISHRLEKSGHTAEQAAHSIGAYRRFLTVLAENPNTVLVPTKAADTAWHEHILFMEKYEADMMELVGGRAYHCPEAPNFTEWRKAVSDTQEKFRERFNIDLPENDFAACLVSVKSV